jgi:urate oxidase
MNIKLSTNAYGKNAVNLSKILRLGNRHEFRQISVNVILEGDFETAHTEGDNRKVLPTDTQKNTVYALAKDHFNSSIEEFGLYLANYFISNNPQLTKTIIEIAEYCWVRILNEGNPHPHAFMNGGSEKHTTRIEQTRNEKHVTSGIRDLLILKTTDSAFKGYPKDQFTTLKEADDRILSTQCEVTWEYSSTDLDFASHYIDIRASLLKTFSEHKSLSVQHTLYAMGENVLKEFDVVKEITLKMPNKHHILMNLEQFGVENNNDIFVATDEPYGYITGTVTRERAEGQNRRRLS